MQIVVSADGPGLDAAVNARLGRCPYYVVVDSETLHAESFENPAVSQHGGAGVKAAEFIVASGAAAVVTGNAGPNAMRVLDAADLEVCIGGKGTVSEAVGAYLAGELERASGSEMGPPER